MDRFKKFIKNEGIRVAYYAGGFALGGGAVYLLMKNKMDGLQICCAKLSKDGTKIAVFLKNNEMIEWYMPDLQK